MRELPQAEHCDLGLIEGEDKTEDLRPRHESAPGGAGTPAEGNENDPTAK